MAVHRPATPAQVRDALLNLIASGRWRAGTLMPNEKELAREFGVSPAIMGKSLEILERERVLTRRQGLDTVAKGQAPGEFARRSPGIVEANHRPIDTEVVVAPIAEGFAAGLDCARLGLAPGSKVYRIQRIISYGGRPMILEQSAVPPDLFPELPQKQQAARSITLLAQQYRLLLGKAEERLSVGSADAACAATLGIALGSRILVLDRVVLGRDGRALEWRVARRRAPT